MELVSNAVIKNKINKKPLIIITVFLLFVLLYGINNTFVYYTSLTPFGVSIVLSLVFIGFNGYVLGVCYTASLLLTNLGLATILQAANVTVILAILEWCKRRKSFKIKKWYLFAFMLFSLVTYVVSSLFDGISWLAVLVSIFLGLLFLFACFVFLDATIGKGMLEKINLDEKICGCIILVIFIVGICGGNIYIFNLGLFFTPLILLIVNRLATASVVLLTAVLIGCGFSIYYLNPIYISLIIVMSIAAIAFKCNCKYLSAIGIVLGYILFVLFFDMGFAVGEVLSVLLGSVSYLFLPSKLIEIFSNVVGKSKPAIMNTIFNNGKQELIDRIKNLSLVFKEMDKVYRDMVKGGLGDDTAKSMLKDELVQSVCLDCSYRDRCYRSNDSYMEECMDRIVSVGYEKRKLSLVDLPEFLTTNCSKVSYLVQYFNSLITSYYDYKTAVNNIDTSRVLIAEQLGAVSRLMETLSQEVDINIKLDNPIENTIKERLGYCGVLCLECVVYERSANIKIINLIVKKSQYNDKTILKTVNKVLKSKYKIDSVKDSTVVGTVDVTISNCPNYDIVFGCSVVAQMGNIVSGDNHSVIPIGDDKYMISICDGMGSGSKANNISKLTINLIENFYKAGFDNETILSTVNKLLSLNETERFSTIDLCVIDTRKNIYDFIKLAACEGYIKRSNGEVSVVSGSGLPIGVLENVSPHITKACISNMDMLVLVSDGVSDVLGEGLRYIISTIDTINPQTMADEILSRAVADSSGVTKDDMTVVCVRVFETV